MFVNESGYFSVFFFRGLMIKCIIFTLLLRFFEVSIYKLI